MTKEAPETLLEFPCDYVFKAFGPNDGAFPEAVRRAASQCGPVCRDAVKEAVSGKGTYVSVSLVVRVENLPQVKKVYAALKKVEGLKYLL